MILTGLAGKKNAAVRMDSIKPYAAYVSRADFRLDSAALVALFPELVNKKTRAEVNKAPLTHGRIPEKYRAVFGQRQGSASNISTMSTVSSSRGNRRGRIERRIAPSV